MRYKKNMEMMIPIPTVAMRTSLEEDRTFKVTSHVWLVTGSLSASTDVDIHTAAAPEPNLSASTYSLKPALRLLASPIPSANRLSAF